MDTRGFARGRLAARGLRFVFLSGAAAFSYAWVGSSSEALADPIVFNYGGYTWSTDRADTEDFDNDLDGFAGRDDVLKLGIYATTPPPNNSGFYQTEGYKAVTGLPVGSSFVSADLYIPADAATSTAALYESIGLWPVIGVPVTDPQLVFPIIQFYNGDNPNPEQPSTGGSGLSPDFVGEIRAWAPNSGGWATLTGAGADPTIATSPAVPINYGDWNTLRVNYVSGDSVGEGYAVYLLNGTVIGVSSLEFAAVDPTTVSMHEIILNSRTNGATAYDVYWSDVRAAMLVPEGVTRTFDDGTTYDADLEIGMNGIAVGGTVAMPYVINGDVDNLGGVLGGNVDVTGNVFNNGTISPGNSPGITNIAGNYIPGVNADFKLEVDLSEVTPDAGVDYDQVNIGANATGSTKVFLYEVQGGPPPPTVPLADTGAVVDIEDIDLITIVGTGGLDNFALGQRYLRNGMDVLLDERDETGTTVIGLKLETPPETYDLASIPVSALAAGDVLLGTYVDRRGLDWQGTKSVWMRAVGGTSEFDTGNGDVDADVVGAQFGMDLLAVGSPSTRLGVTFGYGHQSASIASPSGMDTGTSEGEMPSVGGYITHAEGAFYADLLAQYRFLTYDVDAPMTSGMEVTGGSVDVAAEAGAKFQVSDSVVLIPFAQLLYQHVDLDDSTTGPFSASFTDTDGLTGRLRLLAQASVGGVTGFASVGVAGDLLGDKKTTVTGVTLASDTGGARAEFTAGVEGMVGPGLAVFGSGEVDISFDGESMSYYGRAGVRQEF